MNQPASNADRTSMPNTMERATGRRTSDYNWITEQATVVHMSNNDPTSRWSMRRNAFTPSPEVHPTSVRYFSRDRLITAGSLFDYIQRWGTSMNIVMPPLPPRGWQPSPTHYVIEFYSGFYSLAYWQPSFVKDEQEAGIREYRCNDTWR